MIPTKVHAVLDYLVGLLLIAAPWLFSFNGSNMAAMVAISVGSVTLFYSLLTHYELSLVGLIPFRVHLVLDFLSGCLLAASPWIFGFSELIRWPHVTVGILEIVVVLLSRAPRKR